MRIMTTNIWGDYFKNPVEVREDGIFRIYEEYCPDVIGLQEITQSWYKCKLFDRLSENYFFVGTELDYFKNYVPMVIKKGNVLVAKGYEPLSDTPDITKGITWAVIKTEEGKVLGVCNVHFWWKQNDPAHDMIRAKNAQQLSDVMKYLAGRFNCPVFAFGDMNCTLSSAIFSVVYPANNISLLFDMAEEKDTVSSHHGDPVADENGNYHGKTTQKDYTHSIDHIIALGEGFKVSQYRIVEDQYALDATDHSPVFADIELD